MNIFQILDKKMEFYKPLKTGYNEIFRIIDDKKNFDVNVH